MKTKNKKMTDKTLMDQLREIRDKVSLEIKDMPQEQLKDYLKRKETLYPTKMFAKAGE